MARALRTVAEGQDWGALGGMKRRRPKGGPAYGTPRYASTLPSRGESGTEIIKQCRLPTVFIIRNMYREECVYSHTAFWIDTDLQTGMQSDWVTGYRQPSSQSQAVIQAGRLRNRQAGFLTGMLAGGVKVGRLIDRQACWQQADRRGRLSDRECVTRDFRPLLFSWFEPTLAPDIQAESILEFGLDFAEIFDHKVVSGVCCTPRKSKYFLSKPTF